MRVVPLRAAAAAAGLWALLMAAPASAQSRLLFQSDFSQDTLAQYQIVDPPEDESHWYVWGGALRQNKSVFVSGGHASDGLSNLYLGTTALVQGVSTGNASITASFRSPSLFGVGVVGRYRDAGTFYRLMTCASPNFGGPITRLERWQNGELTLLAYVEGVCHAQEGLNTLRLEMVGSELRGYLNDPHVPLLVARDDALKEGLTGLSLYRTSEIQFTEVLIHELLTLPDIPDGPPPSLSALSASSARPGATLTVAGSGFLPGVSALSLGGYAVPALFPTTQQAAFQVPLGLPPGSYDVEVTNGSRKSGKLSLTVLTGGPALAPLPTSGSCGIRGDLNGDGQVTVADVLKLLRTITGLEP